ncbi:MAG: DUF21 domain-containing protein [Planctomycetota bacterium]|nr:MAG: DUF21 domain-containing protein [Planctomycetota bacterium]
MSELVLFIGLLGWLFFSAFFSGAETGFYVLSRVRLAVSVAVGDGDALMIQQLLRRPSVLLGTVLVGTNLSNFAASVFAMKLLERYIPGLEGTFYLALLNTLIMSPVILIFGEMVPKNIFRLRANNLTRRISLPIMFFHYLFLPVNLACYGVSWLIRFFVSSKRAQSVEILSHGAMEAHLHEGHEAGAISLEQDRIARNILGLEERNVGDVMIPLAEAVTIPRGIKLEEFKGIIAVTRFTRYPVFEGRRDNIVGVVNALDVLYSEKPFSVDLHLRQPKVVKAKDPVDEVLLEMRAARKPLGIVTNPQGRAIGIFTIKDLVEEIVGELREW